MKVHWKQVVTALVGALAVVMVEVHELPLSDDAKRWVMLGLVALLSFGRSVLGTETRVVEREVERQPLARRLDS